MALGPFIKKAGCGRNPRPPSKSPSFLRLGPYRGEALVSPLAVRKTKAVGIEESGGTSNSTRTETVEPSEKDRNSVGEAGQTLTSGTGADETSSTPTSASPFSPSLRP